MQEKEMNVTSAPMISMSDAAAARIATLLQDEPEGTAFRVAVEGGGCSGFQYRFDFDVNREADDHVLEKDGARLVIDEASLELVAGAELDYTTELVGSTFQLKNPNAASGCGCGNSFSL